MTAIETNYRMSEGLGRSIELSSGSHFSAGPKLARLGRQFEKRSSRKVLFELSDDLLIDIGRSRSEANCEARRDCRDRAVIRFRSGGNRACLLHQQKHRLAHNTRDRVAMEAVAWS